MNTSNNTLKASDWLAKGLNPKQIEAQLLQAGTEPRHLPEMMAEIKKLYNAKRTSRGLVIILIGAILCLLSCALTLLSVGDTTFVLYGLTSAGIIVVFAGLMQIFG